MIGMKAALIVVAIVCFPSLAKAADLNLSQEEKDESTRFRASGNFFSFTLQGNAFSGYGTDISVEHATSPNWNFGIGFGQAYTSQGGLQTLYSVIDLSAWYSVTGSFVRKRQVWKNQGTAYGEFNAQRTGGLRIGLGTQQYFFTTAQAAIPYSGLSVKALYEFGWQGSYDLALGTDIAQLANGKRTASATKFFLSVIIPIL